MRSNTKILYTTRGRIAVTDTGGEGVPLVMLHGSGSSMSVFGKQFNGPLAHSYRLIAIDLPGHGASERSNAPKADYTITAIADQLAEVLGLIGVERAFVFGWSLGGHVAVQMMHAHPHFLSGVMLSGVPPIGRGTISVLKAFRMRLDALLGAKVHLKQGEAERFSNLVYGADCTPALVRDLVRSDGHMRSRIKRSLVRGESGPDQQSILANSSIPVAVVNGGQDPMVRLHFVENATYGNLWENTCHVIANAGHSPFLNAPNTFNALLHRFVTDVTIKTGVKPPVEVVDDVPVELVRSA